VVVVGHQAVGVAQPVKTLDDLPQGSKEGVTVLIVLKDVGAGIAPGGHMVQRAVELDSEGSGHGKCQ